MTTPKGPWKAQDINDRNRCWGPVVWDSRFGGKNALSVTFGRNALQMSTMEEAIAVRNALNDHWNNVESIPLPTTAGGWRVRAFRSLTELSERDQILVWNEVLEHNRLE